MRIGDGEDKVPVRLRRLKTPAPTHRLTQTNRFARGAKMRENVPQVATPASLSNPSPPKAREDHLKNGSRWSKKRGPLHPQSPPAILIEPGMVVIDRILGDDSD